jgi:NAD(P)-dependent dehydrogenase (short-subunit alcohol dehydrogenase family)
MYGHSSDFSGGSQAPRNGPWRGGVVNDVTSSEWVTKAADALVRDHGRIDLLVNNAGITSLMTGGSF